MKKLCLTIGLSAVFFLMACQKNIEPVSDDPAGIAGNKKDRGELFTDHFIFYALTEGNRLDSYSLNESDEPEGSVVVTGLQTDERLLAIDFRPATGQLYGLGSTSRLYIINPMTGTARALGAGPFTPLLSGPPAGFDFNPTVDRIRVVTGTGQNLRLNPETGTVAAADMNINGIAGATITSVAYANNVAGATATTLYDIDVTTDKLYRQNPPNNGTLEEVGSLKANLEGEGGFDIAPSDEDPSTPDVALALYRSNKKSTLYSIDLTTGRARKVEKFDKGDLYYGIAIPTNPVAYAVSMNSLLIFNPENPSAMTSKAITGLQAGESLLGIDFRPANSALYALGSNSRIYQLNPSSGAASFVAALSIPISGTSFGFDFNPVPDRIRIISNTGQNLRVNPTDGVAINDGAINPAPAMVTAAAYTNSFAGATATTLYVIDSNTDLLYIQNPPNNGTLTNGKSLGINVAGNNGFDIGGSSNRGWGVFTVDGITKLYGIDLMSGAATSRGSFGGTVSGFAIGPGF